MFNHPLFRTIFKFERLLNYLKELCRRSGRKIRDPPVIKYFSRIAKIVYNSIDKTIGFLMFFRQIFFIMTNVSTVSAEKI